MLRYMHNNVAGITVPDSLIKRMAEAEDPKKEGILIAVELVNETRKIEGVRGAHIQPIEWESAMKDISAQAGLMPRPEGLMPEKYHIQAADALSHRFEPISKLASIEMERCLGCLQCAKRDCIYGVYEKRKFLSDSS